MNDQETQSTIYDRFNELAKNASMNDKEFSGFVGINSATYCSMKKKHSNPGYNLIYQIALKFPNVSLEWLILGIGTMNKDDGTPATVGAATDTPYIEQVTFLRQQICEKDRQISQLMKMANDAQQLALIIGQKNANA